MEDANRDGEMAGSVVSGSVQEEELKAEAGIGEGKLADDGVGLGEKPKWEDGGPVDVGETAKLEESGGPSVTVGDSIEEHQRILSVYNSTAYDGIGFTFTVGIDLELSIQNLKEAIFDSTSWPIEHQRLLHRGRLMETDVPTLKKSESMEENTVRSYGVTYLDTLHLVSKGGYKHTQSSDRSDERGTLIKFKESKLDLKSIQPPSVIQGHNNSVEEQEFRWPQFGKPGTINFEALLVDGKIRQLPTAARNTNTGPLPDSYISNLSPPGDPYLSLAEEIERFPDDIRPMILIDPSFLTIVYRAGVSRARMYLHQLRWFYEGRNEGPQSCPPSTSGEKAPGFASLSADGGSHTRSFTSLSAAAYPFAVGGSQTVSRGKRWEHRGEYDMSDLMEALNSVELEEPSTKAGDSESSSPEHSPQHSGTFKGHSVLRTVDHLTPCMLGYVPASRTECTKVYTSKSHHPDNPAAQFFLLQELGFTDKRDVLKALRFSKGRIEDSIELLTLQQKFLQLRVGCIDKGARLEAFWDSREQLNKRKNPAAKIDA